MACKYPLSTTLAGVQTHKQHVLSLYKRSLRMIEAWYDRREVVMFYQTILRARFENNRCCSQEKAEKYIADAEEELFQNTHWHPRKFPNSPGGVAYARVVESPDWVLDYWHPLEKLQYPEYFAKREQRKLEFLKKWEQLGK